METKIKWLASEDIDRALLARIGDFISGSPFSGDKERGFLQSQMTATSLSAQYVEKVSGKRRLIDPFGSVIELPYVEYVVISFRLSSVFPNVELVNPPRSLRSLQNYIADGIGRSFSISIPEVSVEKWFDRIGSEFPGISACEVEYDNVTVNPAVWAKMRFFGTDRLLAECSDYVGRNQHPSRIKGVLQFGVKKGRVELDRSANLKTNLVIDTRLLTVLRKTIASSI